MRTYEFPTDSTSGAGVIADIAPPDERGGFIGTFAGSKAPTRKDTEIALTY